MSTPSNNDNNQQVPVQPTVDAPVQRKFTMNTTQNNVVAENEARRQMFLEAEARRKEMDAIAQAADLERQRQARLADEAAKEQLNNPTLIKIYNASQELKKRMDK